MTIMMITLSFLLTHFVVQYPPSILEGMNGIILRMNTRQNGVIYLQINMSKEK